MRTDVGIGIVTCNRKEFLTNLLASLPKDIYRVIVNDGEHIFNTHNIINNETNLGVGKSKNILFKHLLKKKFKHIFLIEDDMLIKDKGVFDKYIHTAEVSGLKHLMYGYHGPANKALHRPSPRFIVPYNDSVSVAFNQHCVGSFCYYDSAVLDKVGLNDEKFNNAWEHVEHSYRIVKAGYIPAYWNWPDVANSYDYIDEQACSEDNSTIRPRADWQQNIQDGAKYFYAKHLYFPTTIPDTPQQELYDKIIDIKHQYGKSNK